jgi:hypothetical protein
MKDRSAMTKVFGIGFHKTGTTSLGIALEHFGYRVCHGAVPLRAAFGHRLMMHMLHDNHLDPIMRLAAPFDAFEDNPWFLLYRDLDRRFPGSKFILTIRDESRWVQSALRYFGESESDLRVWIYGVGSPVGHEQRWLERYQRHNGDVKDYFRLRPSDLLVVDWERGDGWTELAAFLGCRAPMPSLPFPRVTKPRHTPAP